ncbi:unnamed protein product [Arctogadus glacialis]
MHHQDFAGESTGTGGRKMSHPSGFHHRRGSSSGSGGASAPSSAAAGGAGNAIAGDEGSGGGPQAGGSSSPGLHHHQLQSQAAGAQMKKKSGFQITSVTSAQVNVSANNSLADDTESYDDMDESHTEDLSSSEMLDVSVSRATDTGVPERSSSDETLNSLHGVDTPGLASPNEPLQPQGAQASMVNGTMHQHQPPTHFPHHHGHQSDLSEGGTPSSAALAHPSPAMIPNSGPGSGPGKPNRISVLNTVAGTTALPPAAGAENRTQTQMMNPGPLSGTVGVSATGPTGYDGASVVGGTTPAAQAAAPNGQIQAPPAPAPTQQTQAPTGSRFRVVKLDTNLEPFRKGRWTCTEYYEKEVPHAAPVAEAPKPSEVPPVADTEAGNQGVAGPGQGPVGPQPPQTLQPHPQGGQDFSSPGAMQSPPQPLGLTALHAQMPLQDLGSGGHLMAGQGPQAGGPSQGIPHQALSQIGYSTAGVPGRQPDFIQPTAPFQTQVPPPGVAMAMGHGGGVQPQLPPPQGQGPAFTQGQPQRLPAQPQHRPYPAVHGAPYVPLTALQADLQPLLAHGAVFPPGGRTSHLEDAQRLFQHRLEQQAAGTLAHMGIAVEASALMVAAAAARLRVFCDSK